MKSRLVVAIVGAVVPFFLWPGTLYGLFITGLCLASVLLMVREHVSNRD